ncbi:hypothetical protein EPUL_002594 [Erysiphe pulchra]|uniref:Uncharacterized protein n=1 Tax=Erysiphe pulchra TaxID=225359 RepID=A0A2S4PW80_9PEZI|nr:hypothetical protein EPUL_002594 [Erysiphe pulchra]
METIPGLLKLEDIHLHWYFNRLLLEVPLLVSDPLLQVRDPAVIKPRGRSVGSVIEPPLRSQMVSTQRDPSLFERVNAAIGVEPLPRRQEVAVHGRVSNRGSRTRRHDRGRGNNRRVLEGIATPRVTSEEPDRNFSCRTMEDNSSLRPLPDFQQALDFLIEERELRWPLEGAGSDTEISLGTQYLDSVASPFNSECEGDDQDQDHLRADVESLAGSSRSTSPIDHTVYFIRLFGSDDM